MPGPGVQQEAAGLPRPPVTPIVRRARPIYRVFVSSTWLDLQPERRALMEALNRMEEMRFVGMEFFGNRPDDTHDASIEQVDLCEVFVGIIGHRYGSGITEAEYRRARQLGLPCFVYFKRAPGARPESTDGDPMLASKLAAFKNDLLRGHTVKEFDRPDELAANATADLHNWVAARWIAVEPGPIALPLGPVATPATETDRTNLLRLLERIEHDWIKGVLEASLHHRAWLELGLDWREESVEHPWDRILVAQDRPIQTLARGDSIAGVFTAAQNTLLVLGEPGAGKTTTLLELARELVARARVSAAEPAPAVLALSTWKGEHRDFSDWIVAELGLRYQVPKRIARDWVEGARLALLLDGLDEVPTERRADCVAAINAFERAYHPPGLAVTCRVTEYDALAIKLRLRAAICLQPLTPVQVEHYFTAAGTGLEPLRRALCEDAGLRELARTPLMLSVMTMAWRDMPVEDLTRSMQEGPEERRRRLFDAYLQTALRRQGKAASVHLAEETKSCLIWMAARMYKNGQSLFAIEQLQPSWLGTRLQIGLYLLLTRTLAALFVAIPFFLWSETLSDVTRLASFAALIGVAIGMVDWVVASRNWGGDSQAIYRLVAVLFTCMASVTAWAVLGALLSEKGSRSSLMGVAYLIAVGVALTSAKFVPSQDINLAASVQWKWRQAIDRALTGLVGTAVWVVVIVLILITVAISKAGFSRTVTEIFRTSGMLVGATLTAVAVASVWRWMRAKRTANNAAVGIALTVVGTELGAVLGDPRNGVYWTVLVLTLIPSVVLGVLSGFSATLIDPSRSRRTGIWFWLRVPVLMGVFVLAVTLSLLAALVVFVAPFVGGIERTIDSLGWKALAFAGICSLMAFFRSGGFCATQHFVLRWLLVKTGHLPRAPEAMLERATQAALLQKVGFGYRFIHALLQEHLANKASEREN